MSGSSTRRTFSYLPGPLRRLDRELAERLGKAPLRLNEYGFDPFGFHPDSARRLFLLQVLLYRYWFRVETHGIQQVPAGPVILVANHAGQFGYDGAMLVTAMLLEAEPPRVARGMGEFFMWKVPWMGGLATQMGTVVGRPENCLAVLQADGCVMAFPEGARGANKPFRKRYQLQRFGQGFARLAVAANAPVVPVGIVGSEEQQPGLVNLEGLGARLGLPSLPITVSTPWLGLLGPVVAFPVKYHIHFGSPLLLEGRPDDEDTVVEAQVERVREAIGVLLARGLRERRGVFR